MKNQKIRCLCEGAILLAAAQVLSYLKLWEMPWGGSVVLSMVPLVLFCIRWGTGCGLAVCSAFGFLQFLFDGGFAIGWQSIVGDYLLAFAILGFAGLVKGKRGAWCTASLIAGALRFAVHYVVGATIWAEYMPETFFGLTMSSPWIYSLLYNLAYMLPNILITVVVLGVLAKPLHKYCSGQDLIRA